MRARTTWNARERRLFHGGMYQDVETRPCVELSDITRITGRAPTVSLPLDQIEEFI